MERRRARKKLAIFDEAFNLGTFDFARFEVMGERVFVTNGDVFIAFRFGRCEIDATGAELLQFG